MCTVLHQVPWACGWGPKDDEASWLAIFCAALEFYCVEAKVPIHDWFHVGVWDASLGGGKAHQTMFGRTTLYKRCLIHQMRWLKQKLGSHYGGKEWGLYLSGEVRLFFL